MILSVKKTVSQIFKVCGDNYFPPMIDSVGDENSLALHVQDWIHNLMAFLRRWRNQSRLDFFKY